MKGLLVCLAAVAFLVPDTAVAGPPADRGRPSPPRLAGYEHALIQLDRARGVLAEPLLRRNGGELVARELMLWRLRTRAARRLLPLLRETGTLRYVEPDRPLRRRAVPPIDHVLRGDPFVPSEYWISLVGADRAEPPGPGKPVTVVDTGVDVTHPEFAGRPATVLLNAQYVAGTADDHGTAVSSLVAAPANGIGLVGVYPEAALQIWDASPRGSGELTQADEIAGILAASRRGPGVINLSLGSGHYDRLEEEAVLTAFRRGSIVVASSGNEFQHGNPEEYPASLNHVLTVAATDERGLPAYFSSSSSAVDLTAPGQRIPVAVPLSYDPAGYGLDDGTSFSAPLVSGATAWVWTARPELDNTQVFDLMRFSARDVWKAGYDEHTGFGMLDLPRALRDRAPIPDPQEPNDDVDHVRPGGLFWSGRELLTHGRRPRAALRARLDASEDPADVYRVALPPRATVTVFVAGDADVELHLWGPRTRSVFEKGKARARDLLAASERAGKRQELVRFTNRTGRPFVAYADVFLANGVRAAVYALSVTSARAAR